MISGVYRIVNTINKKQYIGSSININRRFRNHILSLNRHKHCNPILQSAWDKYGKDAFIFEVIEECDPNDTMDRETISILKYNSISPNGYNLTNDARKPRLGKH